MKTKLLALTTEIQSIVDDLRVASSDGTVVSPTDFPEFLMWNKNEGKFELRITYAVSTKEGLIDPIIDALKFGRDAVLHKRNQTLPNIIKRLESAGCTVRLPKESEAKVSGNAFGSFLVYTSDWPHVTMPTSVASNVDAKKEIYRKALWGK